MNVADAALDYVARGWAVFPMFSAAEGRCRCRRPDCSRPGKHPIVTHGLREATTDVETIAAWFQRWPWANLGIATGGPSGIIVVDVDRPAGATSIERLESVLGPLPVTLQAVTGGGGLHMVYAHPGSSLRNSIGRLAGFPEELPNVDLRADGGAIVAPPSSHVSGRPYEWVDLTVPVAPAPAWLRDAPRPVPVIPPPAALGPGRNTGYGLASLRRELALFDAVRDHGANNRLNVAALALGELVAGGELEQATVEEQLTNVALAVGLTQPAIRNTIASGMSKGLRQPRVAPHRAQGTA